MKSRHGTNRLIKSTGISITFLLIFSFPAQAYLDPVSTSMVLQLLVGAFIAVGVWFKTSWHKVTSFFGKNDTEKDDKSSKNIPS